MNPLYEGVIEVIRRHDWLTAMNTWVKDDHGNVPIIVAKKTFSASVTYWYISL